MNRPVLETSKPTLAVWKFASCDGCQLSLLDLEDHLLEIAGAIEIAHFPEATTAHVEGPYTVSLVEGSITTAHDLDRITTIREQSDLLVTIGACATSGGIQALKNLADVDEYVRVVYAHPEYISTLATSTPIADHVAVDIEVRGCPVNKYQLLELIGALLIGRKPNLPTYSVCVECKARGISCVMVAEGTPCLGPITQAGCGAICPAFDRGCYGCFGPAETVNVGSLATRWNQLGMHDDGLIRALRTFNANSPAFAAASQLIDQGTGLHAQD